jgi:hypothetical protein
MKFRTLAVAGGLAVTLLTAGCAKSVAGQAEVLAGAVAPVGSSVAGLTDLPQPSAPPVSGGDATAPDETSQNIAPTSDASAPSADSTTSDASTTPKVPSTTSAPSSSASDKSVPALTGPTSIPGLSADCNKVLAAITAFSSVLQGVTSGADTTISQATVDAALKQLPASGLPAQPQADINVLRTTISGAGGKTVTELALSMTDGKVVAALEDLSGWATTNCT